MVPVATARGAFEAKVIAARLGSDGIVWELRGGVDSVYPVGLVQVLVDEGDAGVARALLVADDVDSAFDSAFDDDDEIGPGGLTAWFTVVALVALAVFVTLRVLSLV